MDILCSLQPQDVEPTSRSAVFAAFVLGFSSILTGINFITTIHRLRAPGMTWHRMPLFVWSLYGTAWIQVLATPIIGITLLLVVAERIFGVGVFDPAKGGDPILYQHLFWIYSHPAVYIMILPAMGAITEIIPTFAHRTIFGYQAIAYSSIAIAALGIPGLGAPHVHQRHGRTREYGLLAADLPCRGTQRHQGL